MTPRVLIVGAGGQLGSAMAGAWPDAKVAALARADLDVTARTDVEAAVRRTRPDLIVNCSAYTNVDGAESAPETALAVNAWGAHLLAEAATQSGAALVHFSTDFVFDGRTGRPYSEQDAPNPQGAYAASKLLGEWMAAGTPRHYVLRVESLFGGPRAQSSVDRMREALRTGAEVRAFADRTVSPSYVEDVVRATRALVEHDAAYGTYHCVNTGWTTWSGLARTLARLMGVADPRIVDVRMAEARLKAPRPAFAALSNAKIVAAGAPMPTWEDALARYVAFT
jgi:dTDP-4-dehydrorhamnose reductase